MKDYTKLQQVSQMSLAEAALFYVTEFGWHILRLQEGKKVPPEGSRGHKDAVNNANVVNMWWTHNPKLNIGLSLAKSGLVVVDVDDYKSECEWKEFSADKDVKLTLTQKSSRGGTHYFYEAMDGESYPAHPSFEDGKSVKGVDFKHDGYVLLSPSVIYPENIKENANV